MENLTEEKYAMLREEFDKTTGGLGVPDYPLSKEMNRVIDAYSTTRKR